MIRINLIPHRAEFRKKQIIEYITVFSVAVVSTLLLIVLVDIWETQTLTELQEEQAMLRTRNDELSKKIGELRNLDALRKDVESKLQIVDELQEGRFRSLKTMQAISESIPQNVWIDQMQDDDGKLVMSGFGESSQAIANFMRAVELSNYFADVALQFDQEFLMDDAAIRKFIVSFRRLTLAEQNAKAKKETGEANEP